MDCNEIEKWAGENPETVAALAERFERLDATLTHEDIARAYVAKAYVGDGYSDLDFSDMVISSMMKTGDIENALRLSWDTACRYPFNLNALDSLLRLVPQEHDIWKLAAWRFSRLLKAIASTGDGTTTSSAFCVICVRDEYMLMRSMFEITGIHEQQLVIEGMRSYDRFHIDPTDLYPHDTIYFEITPFNITAL